MTSSAKSDAILARLLGLHPKKIDLSLGRTQNLLALLGNPQSRLPPVLHVAGTNGKGSTIAFLRAMLEAAGNRVHVYTSPHLVSFNERIRLAGNIVGDEQLADALERCERVNDASPITFFEITTAAAFLLFSETQADYLLLEVGLGGRFDSTNVIDDPVMTIVTPVSMDHTEFLGDTVAKIAFEKAGILKRNVPAVLGAQYPEALAVLEQEAARLSAPLLVEGQDFQVLGERGRITYEDGHGLLDLPQPRLPGRHQHHNAATAIAALRCLNPDFPVHCIERGLAAVHWPARLQRLGKGKLAELAPPGAELWLDGGHNVEGGRVVGEAMADFEDRMTRPLIVICGTLANKDTTGFLRHFKGLAQEVIAVPVGGDHSARPAREVAMAAREAGLAAVACDDVVQALSYLAARSWPVPPRILITGSLYLAGEVLRADGAVLA